MSPTVELNKGRWWSREDLLLLLLLAAVMYLPGLSRISLFDRDEPRFATAAREMGESGDYVVPRFNGNLRPDKPPLLYWLMNVTYELTGGAITKTGGANELGARLPSAVFGGLTLIVVYFAAGRRFGRTTGLIAALMLGTVTVYIVESRLATADSTMLFFTICCMHFLWRAWDLRDSGQKLAWWETGAFWLALAAGTLAKGVPLLFVFVPMIVLSITAGRSADIVAGWRRSNYFWPVAIGTGILVIGIFNTPAEYITWGKVGLRSVALAGIGGVVAYLALRGNWRWVAALRPAVGFPLLLLIVGAWVAAAWVKTDGLLLKEMMGKHVVDRASKSVDGHAVPSGFFTMTILGTFWPWSVLILPMLFHSFKRLAGKVPVVIDRRPYIFLAAWIIPNWIVYELVQSKLVHYVLPLIVGMVILCADTLVESWHRSTEVLDAKWFASAKWVMMVIWVVMGCGVLYLAHTQASRELFYPCVVFAGALMAVGVGSTISWGRPSWPFVVVLGWGAALLVLNTLVLPEISSLKISRVMGDRMLEIRRDEPEFRFAFQGYEEPSLVFYAGAKVDKWGALDEFLERTGTGKPDGATPYLCVVDAPTRAEIEKRGLVIYPIWTMEGLNVANFKPMTVTLYGTRPHKKYVPVGTLTRPSGG